MIADRRRALPPAAAVVAAMVLVFAGIGVSFYDKEIYRAQKLQDIRAQAQIVAATVAPALRFDDSQAAQEYLNALNLNPSISAAAVYDIAGNLVAQLGDSTTIPARGTDIAPGAEFQAETLTVVAPIRQSVHNLGLVYLSSATEPLVRRVTRYGGIMLLVTMAALLLAVLLSAHTALRRANRELAARAGQLADANARLLSEMEERERIQEALRHSQKMEAVGQLTGGIAHDFNNMLAIIISSIDILKRRAQRGDQNLSQYADRALEGAHRAATLTQRLLAFSRRQTLSPEPIEPNRLVGAVSELLRRTLGEAIQVENVLAGGLWRAKADPHQLESTLVNLAVNSRDAMPHGGRINIETSNAYLDEAYASRQDELTPGQYVQIAVTDTGEGMTADVLAKCFEPFFTTKPIGKGTGLGLSQVYGFAKQSGGHLAVHSEPGRGTTVRLYLPRHGGNAAIQEAHQTPEILDHPSNITVLVVEDEGGVRHLTTEALRELGYRVVEAESGRRALDLLREDSAITLLFTDVVMPHMNGRDLAKESLKIRPDLKILFTSGYTKEGGVSDGMLDVDVHLVPKPFTLEQLQKSVRLVLEDADGREAT